MSNPAVTNPHDIPTAEEMLIQACIDAGFTEDYAKMIFKINPDSSNAFLEAMIKHTKLHVTKALDYAYDNVDYYYIPYDESGDRYVKEDSIKNAYPLDNIK